MFHYTATRQCSLVDLNGDVYTFHVRPGGIEDQEILVTTRPLAKYRVEAIKTSSGDVRGGMFRSLTPDEVATQAHRAFALSLPASEYDLEPVVAGRRRG